MAKMIVIAGPPGGGKSTALGATYFSDQGIPYFNIDVRCRELHGSSQQIPEHIRKQANTELRDWAWAHISNKRTFGFETTLRADFAIRAAGFAKAGGLETELHYVAAPFKTHVDRVTARAEAGGHAASEPTLAEMNKASMENLPTALAAFDAATLYDATGDKQIVQVQLQRGELTYIAAPLAPWVYEPLREYQQLISHERETDFER